MIWSHAILISSIIIIFAVAAKLSTNKAWLERGGAKQSKTFDDLNSERGWRKIIIYAPLMIIAGLCLMWLITTFSAQKALIAVTGFLLTARVVYAICYIHMSEMLGFISCAMIGIVGGVAATSAWIISPNWMTQMILGMFIACDATVSGGIFLRKTKVVIAALLVFFCYDVAAVFFSDVMVVLLEGTKAIELYLPIVLPLPSSLSPNAQLAGVLGLGDVVIPGFLLVRAAIIDEQECGVNVFKLTCLAYFAGLMLAFASVIITGNAQPALFYILPCVLIGFWIGVRRTQKIQCEFA